MKRLPKSAYLRIQHHKHPQIELRWTDGTRKFFTVKTDQKTAQEIVETIKRKIALKTFDITQYIETPESSMTLEKFYDLYMKYRDREVSLGNIEPNTVVNDQSAFKLFIEILGPKVEIRSSEETEIKKFIHHLIHVRKTKYGRNYSPRSIQSYLKHLTGAFSYAMRTGLISDNPFLQVQKPKIGRKKIRFLSEEEIEKFRICFNDQPQWKIDSFNFALWTGCRLSSIVTVKKEDLLKKHWKDETDWLIRLVEKGEKERDIPLLPEPLVLIQERIGFLNDSKLHKAALDEIPRVDSYQRTLRRIQEGFLFWEISDRTTVTHSFLKARREIGLGDDVTFHTLRKTFATYGLEQGLSLETVQYILGHSSVRVTEEAYAEITKRKVINEFKLVKAK